MKYKSKTEFVADCEHEWGKLWDLVDDVDNSFLNRRHPSDNKPDQTIVDVLAHLYAWHRLFFSWYKDGLAGQPELPAQGYNWRQTPELNQELFDEFEHQDPKSVIRKLKLSHNRLMKLVDSLSEKKLMQPGAFKWTGKNGLISYVSANSASHYRWAIKKIKKMIASRKV